MTKVRSRWHVLNLSALELTQIHDYTNDGAMTTTSSTVNIYIHHTKTNSVVEKFTAKFLKKRKQILCSVAVESKHILEKDCIKSLLSEVSLNSHRHAMNRDYTHRDPAPQVRKIDGLGCL